MKELCPEIKKIVYADDTTFIVSGKTKNDAIKQANIALNQVYNYFTYNKLSLNPSKTKYITFSRKKVNRNIDHDSAKLVINGEDIEETKKIKFLGLYINNKLTWEDHKSYIKSKISKSIGILYNCRTLMKYHDILSMYRTFVEPFFMYCLPVWGHSIRSESDDLIKLQNKTLRILFQCYRSEDAWKYACDHVLTLKLLYKHEMVKLCFKHLTAQLPPTFSAENMPDQANDTEALRSYNLRQLHHNKLKCFSNATSFTENCVSIWNNLPDNLRKIPYSQFEPSNCP